ncbi:NAD(P)/FAD-dependent oxidoreductase [Phnomibacter sp. MR]|uniref:NAD(P)/FAD-dependent oxidoreductase n=1 Tax=Phnomibacter sp. MR TaxID=3042318 RepID=UPI003A812B69
MHTIRKVVIIGGGFAGLQLARKLNNKPSFAVTLIDRFNYHQFQPLFYQVATGGLDASNISFPLRKVFHNSKNVRIRLDKVTAIDTKSQVVHTEHGTQIYDDLVIATGADTNFFGNADLEQHTYPMKSTVEALQLRHKIITNFEALLYTQDPILQQRLLTIVVVGGGPTGVELSGAIAEMKSFVLPKDYPEIDFSKMRILLLEGTGKTLGAMSESSSRQSQQYLQQLGVEVMTNTLMDTYDGKTITLKDGKTIESGLVIWAAGIKGNVPDGIDPSLIVRGNRIKVNRFNQVEGFNNVYALGDVAWMQTANYPNGHPQVANVAINQAANLASNWHKYSYDITHWKAYEYNDLGSMATVGRNKAVVDLPFPKSSGKRWHFGGLFAWLVWMFLHLMLILGVKNKLMVFINWMYNYLTYDQSLRLIFREFDRDQRLAENT